MCAEDGKVSVFDGSTGLSKHGGKHQRAYSRQGEADLSVAVLGVAGAMRVVVLALFHKAIDQRLDPTSALLFLAIKESEVREQQPNVSDGRVSSCCHDREARSTQHFEDLRRTQTADSVLAQDILYRTSAQASGRL